MASLPLATYKRNVMFSPSKALAATLGAALVTLASLCAPLPAVAQGRVSSLPDFKDLY
jgi:hypothetical protein